MAPEELREVLLDPGMTFGLWRVVCERYRAQKDSQFRETIYLSVKINRRRARRGHDPVPPPSALRACADLCGGAGDPVQGDGSAALSGRWRWRVTRAKGEDRVGEWQATAAEARQDALAHGVATYSEEHGWFFDVFTKLEQESG